MILELTEEQAAFQQAIAAFAADRIAPAAAAIDEHGRFPRALVQELASRGLLGVTIPREMGGAGRDYVSYALALEAVGRASAVLSVIASVNNSLVAEPIAEFGTDEQQQTWLRRLATRSARSRCRKSRRDRTPRTSRRPRGSTIAATCSTAARSGSPTPRRPISRSCSPRRSRAAAAAASARSSCRWTRRG